MQAIVPGMGPEKVTPENLNGRIAVITGGALGIGFEISRALAHAGCRVIMVSRKADQGADAMKTIREESPGAEAEWRECDLGDLAKVREVFTKLRGDLPRLDFVVCSSGINVNQHGRDADNIDRHFGVNYLGHYYAINVLWSLIRRTSKIAGASAPRIVFESSNMHKKAPQDVKFASLEEINDPNVGSEEEYGRTKLAMILFGRYGLVERVIKPNNDNIYAISVHPGPVNTTMQAQWKDAHPGITGQLLYWYNLARGRSVEQGSYSALWALTSPKVEQDKENANGAFYTDPDTPGERSAQAEDPKLGENLWMLSEKIVKEKLGEDALVDWNVKV
jgi:NAD(P)-dependent dehydrogenase (short-subunit alcohol dehydrogenase family)